MVIAHATTVAEILAGRVLTGLSSGFYSTAVQLSRPCEVLLAASRMMAIRILFTYILGSLFEWRTVPLYCSAFPSSSSPTSFSSQNRPFGSSQRIVSPKPLNPSLCSGIIPRKHVYACESGGY